MLHCAVISATAAADKYPDKCAAVACLRSICFINRRESAKA